MFDQQHTPILRLFAKWIISGDLESLLLLAGLSAVTDWLHLTLYHKVLNLPLVSTKIKFWKTEISFQKSCISNKVNHYSHTLMWKLKHWKGEEICQWWKQNRVLAGLKIFQFSALFYWLGFWNSGFGDFFKGSFLGKGVKNQKKITNSLEIIRPISSSTFWSFTEGDIFNSNQKWIMIVILLIIEGTFIELCTWVLSTL